MVGPLDGEMGTDQYGVASFVDSAKAETADNKIVRAKDDRGDSIFMER